MSRDPREDFERIRSAIIAYRSLRDDARRKLELKYGSQTNWVHYSLGEQRKLERLDRAYDRACDRMWKLLDGISERDWKRGVPAYWVCEQLTYDDAVRSSKEALSVEPPKAYGY